MSFWTTCLPDREGWYWAWKPGASEPEIVEVVKRRHGLVALRAGIKYEFELPDFHYWSLDRIPEAPVVLPEEV
jgi:hypothetical protein